MIIIIIIIIIIIMHERIMWRTAEFRIECEKLVESILMIMIMIMITV